MTDTTTLPTNKSTDQEWLSWIKKISFRYGKANGRMLFLQLWTKRGSDLANTLLLRQTLKKDYGFEINESVWNKITDLGGGISDTFASVFRAGKIITIVVGSVALLALAVIVKNAVTKSSIILR